MTPEPPRELVPARDTTPAPQAPEDAFAYRIAVGALGLALVAFLIGAAVIAAGGKPVPTQYWSTGSAIAGAIIGILAPTPTPANRPSRASAVRRAFGVFADVVRDLWQNRGLFMLLFVFAASLGFAIWRSSPELETVAAAAGGALIGLLAPPPGQQTTP